MSMSDLSTVINGMLALILALTFHECAHAFVAYWQGDRTAKAAGRLTLNPIPHIDPVGTLLFPLIGSITGAALIGWAKPVPVDTRYLRNPKWGHVMVAAAGPAANLLLCAICILLFRLAGTYGQAWDGVLYPFMQLFKSLITINAILAVFNLLPIPPLDGGTVFGAFLPDDWRVRYEEAVAPYGMFIILALLFTGGLGWMGAVAMGWVRFSDGLISFIL